jgi:predicted RNase H-like nuclease (RuvC/YqgF family)
MSDSSPLTTGEFVRTMNAFGERIDALTAQVTITNGRVGALEREAAVEAEKVETLRREMGHLRTRQKVNHEGESAPITRRDLAVAAAAVTVLWAVIQWLTARGVTP